MGTPATTEVSDRPSAVAGNVILIGPRAAGKSTVGAAWATALGIAFVDLDEELGRRAGQPAAGVLAAEGEVEFRRRESEVLLWAAGLREHVVATGGGAVLHAEAFKRLAATGLVVALIPSVETLIERQRHAPRPALRPGALEDEVRTLLAEREDLYRSAAQIIVVDDLAVSILDRLQSAGESRRSARD